MPKDANFNTGEKGEITIVNSYSITLSANDTINMWGNVWKWASAS